jgi:hypothetical protein
MITSLIVDRYDIMTLKILSQDEIIELVYETVRITEDVLNDTAGSRLSDESILSAIETGPSYRERLLQRWSLIRSDLLKYKLFDRDLAPAQGVPM